jgi:hypothetical protein
MAAGCGSAKVAAPVNQPSAQVPVKFLADPEKVMLSLGVLPGDLGDHQFDNYDHSRSIDGDYYENDEERQTLSSEQLNVTVYGTDKGYNVATKQLMADDGASQFVVVPEKRMVVSITGLMGGNGIIYYQMASPDDIATKLSGETIQKSGSW